MAGAQERVLRRRISSVKTTKKITRAMELIAASRVMRAQQRARASKPYAAQITSVIEDLAASGANIDHPLLRQATDVRRVAFIILSSDRGLAGAYNSSVLRAAEREVEAVRAEGADYDLVLIGRKAEGYFRFRSYRIEKAYQGISDKPSYDDAREIGEYIAERFISGAVDRVVLVYTEFVSLGVQRPVVRNFLPLQTVETIATGGQAENVAGYDFEPSPEAVLEALLPRYIEARLYSALLESAAAEHASRQRAMKSATDNAEELIIRYGRQLNRARQDSITTEIMEIVGGAEGLKEDKGSGEDLLIDHPFGTHLFPQHLDKADHPRTPPLSV
ncbi:MAG: F0F1 ATP synthase subunit gamma [Acidimicrobiia bacterium]|nr:F0F1 ATP synthase subunit gamma [Acidimicrobiia bacterium]